MPNQAAYINSTSVYMPLAQRQELSVLPFVQRPGLILWAAFLAILSVPVLTLVDIPVAHWFSDDKFSADFSDAIELTRGYAHGSGIFFIFLTVFLLTPERRWLIPRIAIMTCGGGAIATIMKMFVLRPKPSQINLDFANLDTAWLWRFDWTLDQVANFDARTRAFPSGNVATAVALTIGLCLVAPRGRWLYAMLCGLTIMQRLHSQTHFLSDVVGGAAAGLLWSYVCLSPRMIGSLFDKMEPANLPDATGELLPIPDSTPAALPLEKDDRPSRRIAA